MAVSPGVTAAARSFVRRLQSHPKIYGEFRRVMNAFSSGKLEVVGVISELDTLFQFHSDLLTGYRVFLPPQFRPSSSSSSLQSRKNNVNFTELRPCIHFMNKVQKRFADEQGVIKEYLEIIRASKKGKLSYNDAYDAIERIFGNENQDLVDEFELLLVGDNGIRKKKKKKTEEAKFKKDEKSNSNSNSNNDDEIKPRIKKVNYRMEDEMFEFDMRLDPLRTTIKSATTALKKILEFHEEHQIINIDEHFSAVSLSCIRKEYKERGCSVIQQLREDPKHVLPQILEHLDSKEKELTESREKLHQHWIGYYNKKKKECCDKFIMKQV